MLSNDIELEVTPRDRAGEYEVRVIRAACGGEPRESLRLDVARMLGMRGTLESTVLASAAHARSGRVPELERPLRDAGQELFEGLFTGAVRETYRSSAALARDHGTRLRVVLHLEAPELAALPWEAMWDPQEQAYLCRKEPLVRHVPAPYTPDPLPITPPLRILGLVASPRGLPPLDVERERGHLVQALERAVADGRIRLDWLEDGTWDALQDHLLNSTCHVLHFIGHGDYDPDLDQGRVALVREDDGRADWVEAGRLIDLLNQADPTPRLVVLNSCSSGQSGTQDPLSGTASVLVHGGVSAVAAMQFRISDPAAVAFPRGFYKALAAGKTVEAALSSGRIAILGRGESLEWVTPVLYMRGGATQLFTIAPPTPPAQQPSAPTPGDSQAPDPAALTGAEPQPDLSTAVGGVEADPDWNDALEAYFTENWAAARDLLTGIVARHPGDPKASAMLRHAQQQADLAQWYDQAQDAATAGDWQLAASALDRIVHAEPGYRDASGQLEQARWQQRRASLIDDMRRLHAAERWQAVLAAGADLAELDPDTPDPDGMISHARQALADLDLADRYTQGLHQLENGDRVAALATFTSIEQERPAYRNTPALLEKLTHPQTDDQAPDQHQKPDVQAPDSLGPPPPTRSETPAAGGPGDPIGAERQPPAGIPPTTKTRRWRAALTTLIAILLLLGIGGIWLLTSGGGGQSTVSTGDVGNEPVGVAVSPDGTRVYVTNPADDTVSVLDRDGDAVSTGDVGNEPVGVAVSPDGTRVYVANKEADTISVLNRDGDVVSTADVGNAPLFMAVSPDGTRVYVANHDADTVSVLDEGGDVVSTVDVGNWPIGVAVSPDGTRVYVANNQAGTVSVLDRDGDVVSTAYVGNGPWGVAVSPDGTRVYVANNEADTVSVLDRDGDVVSTADVGNGPTFVAVSPDGTRVYVANNEAGTVSVLDRDGDVVSTVDVGNGPIGVAVSPDGTRVYVANNGADTVSVLAVKG